MISQYLATLLTVINSGFEKKVTMTRLTNSKSIAIDIAFIIAVIFGSNLIGASSPDENDKIPVSERDLKSLLALTRKFKGLQVLTNSTLCILGQSLSWVGVTLETLNETEPIDLNEIIYLPFSGKFLRYYEEGTCFTSGASLPTREEIESYRRLLKKLKMDPRSILRRYQDYDSVTVVADLINTGASLASFLWILLTWAEEDGVNLGFALDIVGVAVVTYNFFPSRSMNIDGGDNIYFHPLKIDKVFIALIAQPERNGKFKRLVAAHPHEEWTKTITKITFKDDPSNVKVIEAIRTFIEKDKREKIRTTSALPILDSSSPVLVSNNFDSGFRLTEPLFTLDSVANLSSILQDLPSTSSGLHGSCFSGSSRKRGDQSTQLNRKDITMKMYLILTYNTNGTNSVSQEVYYFLKRKYTKKSGRIPFLKFLEGELENPDSAASKTLNQACKKLKADTLHFSQDNTSISSCMRRHRLFQCGGLNKRTVIRKNISDLVGSTLSGRNDTWSNVLNQVENLVQYMIRSLSQAFINDVIEVTKEVVLACSDNRIVSTMRCPTFHDAYLEQILLSWFGLPFPDENINEALGPEFVDG